MFINFFPGHSGQSREISIDEEAAYGLTDIFGLVDSMLSGCTASTNTHGVQEALEDGSLWAELCVKYGDSAVQETLEELHATLAALGSGPEPEITPADESLIKEWLNCREASVDPEGDVFVEGPMAGHWLSDEKKSEFLVWRDKQ